MIQQIPPTPARVARLKTFAATDSDLAAASAAVEAAVNAWLESAGEQKIHAVQWSVYDTTATAAVWYID